MCQEGANPKIRDILNSIQPFRELIVHLREAEAKLGSQNQSPDSSVSSEYVRCFVPDYLSKTELLVTVLLCYYLNTTTLRYSCPCLLADLLVSLPERIEYSSFLRNQERIELWKLFQRKVLFLTEDRPFTGRQIKGILSDPKVINKVRSRFYQRIRPTRSKVRRTMRHRGYRDHGTLRPNHRWLPTEDFSLTEQQNRIERERSRLKRAYQLAITGQSPFDYSDDPFSQYMPPPIDPRLDEEN